MTPVVYIWRHGSRGRGIICYYSAKKAWRRGQKLSGVGWRHLWTTHFLAFDHVSEIFDEWKKILWSNKWQDFLHFLTENNIILLLFSNFFRKRERVSISQLRGSWRPFLVSMTMMLLLQTSGLLVLVYYAVSIFQVGKAVSSL